MAGETVPGLETLLEKSGLNFADAFDIVRDALIAESASNANPFINSKGFYESEFIKDHGGNDNVSVEYSDDGEFKILKAKRNLVPAGSPNYDNYRLVNSHPEYDIIVVPN